MMHDEVSPSTVVYRSVNTRASLQHLIDSVAPPSDGDTTSAGSTATLPSGGVASGDAQLNPQARHGDSADSGDANGVAVPPSPAASVGGNKASEMANKLDWKEGVFVPCLLNIWGVIMFLRLGWVVGQAGIVLASVVVLASKVVTTITALSLCAVCTNGEVKGGGVYFLISRALGPVFGGTIGVLFFIAQAVATSMYVIGFAEALVGLFVDVGVGHFTGSELNDIRIIGLATTVALLLVALVGVSWYAKTQMGLLATLILSMLSIFIGAFFPGIPDEAENAEAGFVGFGWRNLGSNYVADPAVPDQTQSFFTVFAVFFPAVTGIMAGANLSGDLKDPGTAIPKGTLGAIAVTFVTYMGLIWVVGLGALACADAPGLDYCANKETAVETGRIPEGGLLFNKLVMQNMSIWSPLFYLGVFAATLSSALASLVGAPRILQSVASDALFPWPWFNFFGAGRGPGNEPVRAYVLTFAICSGCVVIGKLDVIAPLISNFFLVSYAFTNYACFASSFARYPGWRPSFRYYNKWLSLTGFALCIVVMFLMDWLNSIITVALGAALYGYLHWLDPDVNWGAAGEARQYFATLRGMERLQGAREDHVKTFRPQFLVMSGRPTDRPGLVRFVSMLHKGGGIVVCGDVVVEKPALIANGAHASVASDDVSAAPPAATPALEAIAESDSDDELNAEEGQHAAAPAAATSSVRPESAGKDAHVELASKLAARLATVQARRAEGEDFLSTRGIWGAKRCPGAFYDAVVADSLLSGFNSLLQCAGVGRLRPNTVVMGFKRDWRQSSPAAVKEYEQLIRIALASNLGVMVLRDDADVFGRIYIAPRARPLARLSQAKVGSSKQQQQKQKQPAASLDALEAGGCTTSSNISLDAGSASSITLDSSSINIGTTTRELAQAASAASATAPLPQFTGETIDVWWVADDGGLTMLIPYLLKAHRSLRGSQRLRVLTVTSQSSEETRKLHKSKLRMVHLLDKLRIGADVEAVENQPGTEPSAALAAEFDALTSADGTSLTLADLSEQERAKTFQALRLVELMRERSATGATSMVFATLPIPETGFSVGLHVRWMHMLTEGMPPTVLLRGNNENVLTFIC